MATLELTCEFELITVDETYERMLLKIIDLGYALTKSINRPVAGARYQSNIPLYVLSELEKTYGVVSRKVESRKS